MATIVPAPGHTDDRSWLDVLLRPKSVAMIGASSNPKALGGRPLGFLADYGFGGCLYPVNLKSEIVQGRAAYRSVTNIREPVDVALVAVPAGAVPGVLRECRDAGVRVAVVLSSGFGEGMGAGADLAREMTDDLQGTGMRVIGPNCEGLASLPANAPMTFSPVFDVHRTGLRVRQGNVAVVSQSGGLGFAVAQWCNEVGVGVSYIVSAGNELDIDAIEIASELAETPETDVIVLLVEAVADFDHFRSMALRCKELGKHLVVAKLGASAAGARGALAHTGHVAGDAAQHSQLIREVGALEVHDEEELVDVVQAVAKLKAAPGRRVGIVTTSGGAGVWLTDACEAQGMVAAELSPQTQEMLIKYMPAYGSPVNPVDLTAQFIADGAFAPAVQVLMASGEVDAVILATSLSSAGRLEGDRAALRALRRRFDLPVAVYSYTRPAPSCIEILEDIGVPWYTSSFRAARGLAAVLPAAGA